MDASKPSLRSRFLKGKRQEAVQEIEGWIASTRADTIKAGAARTNQPSKNITEQKMLDSKLYDMSKQRFNFVLQCQWQRKLFIEKQKRKTAVMRDLMKNVDITTTSENPFSTAANKRRGTTVIPGPRYQQAIPMQAKAVTTEPRPRAASPAVTRSTDTDVFRFVTEKEAQIAAQIAQEDDDNSTVKSSGKTDPIRFRSWPMCDARFHKLSASLSSNYDGTIHRANKTKTYTSPSYITAAKVF